MAAGLGPAAVFHLLGASLSGMGGLVGWDPLPGALLSCFGKKVTKEADLGEALGSSLFGLVGMVAWVARLEAALP